ncbi:MAG TPA: enoyl-CoA hydratase-related protein [Chloroflexia bacterium]|jgi:methylglutaconyl-CoA hydratase
MATEHYQHLRVEIESKVCRVTLSRPDVHNAFNSLLIEELRQAFEKAARSGPEEVRAVVLAGEGKSFCAGADVNWMRESLLLREEENIADALRMARMFDTINKCPVPVIGRIHGAALGGGMGLAAVCDVVVMAEGTVCAFSEAKLGIAPAVISPYVLAKIGQGHARALFLTAERFRAERALQVGLAHYVVPAEELDGEVDRVLREVMSSSPSAIARAKQLIASVPRLSPDEAMRHTTETIAALRVSEQGQEGLRAFLERRTPDWAT